MAKRNRENFKDEETAQEKLNAADQVERDNELAALRDVLVDPKVRSFLWRALARAGMFKTHFNPNAAIMGHNTGLADMGTWILNEILEANPEAWIAMQHVKPSWQISAHWVRAEISLTKSTNILFLPLAQKCCRSRAW